MLLLFAINTLNIKFAVPKLHHHSLSYQFVSISTNCHFPYPRGPPRQNLFIIIRIQYSNRLVHSGASLRRSTRQPGGNFILKLFRIPCSASFAVLIVPTQAIVRQSPFYLKLGKEVPTLAGIDITSDPHFFHPTFQLR